MQKGDAIELVETFIQRCHDLEYVFTEDARKLTAKKDPSGYETILWANVIADAMTEYTLNKGGAERLKYAVDCLTMINKAFAAAIVREGPALIKRHKEAQAKMLEQQAQIEGLFKQNALLQARIEVLQRG